MAPTSTRPSSQGKAKTKSPSTASLSHQLAEAAATAKDNDELEQRVADIVGKEMASKAAGVVKSNSTSVTHNVPFGTPFR